VDLYVFPELHKTPDGALEAEFYAFKIPDSTFLVFQATVRTCRGPCEPVICNDRERGHAHFPSWGRRRRDVAEPSTIPASDPDDNSTPSLDEHNVSDSNVVVSTPTPVLLTTSHPTILPPSRTSDEEEENVEQEMPGDPEEDVHELFRVYMSRSEVPSEAETSQSKPLPSFAFASSSRMPRDPSVSSGRMVSDKVCVSQSGYYALVTAITVLTTICLFMGVTATILIKKNHMNKVIQ